MNLWRDILLSFCPESVRLKYRPYSPSFVISPATVLGVIQFLGCAALLVERYRHFFMNRALLWAKQMGGQPEWMQSGGTVLITVEFLLYPLSFLLFYLMLEGFLRFAAGICPPPRSCSNPTLKL